LHSPASQFTTSVQSWTPHWTEQLGPLQATGPQLSQRISHALASPQLTVFEHSDPLHLIWQGMPGGQFGPLTMHVPPSQVPASQAERHAAVASSTFASRGSALASGLPASAEPVSAVPPPPSVGPLPVSARDPSSPPSSPKKKPPSPPPHAAADASPIAIPVGHTKAQRLRLRMTTSAR
jgi:hypothetical protein